MALITLEQVKALLGITDATHDDQIETAIIFVDMKIKQFCNNDFNRQFQGQVESGNDLVMIYESGRKCGINDIKPKKDDYYRSGCTDYLTMDLRAGTQIIGQGIPAGAYIKQVYYDGLSGVNQGDNNTVPYIQLSETPTESNSGALLYAGINIAYLPIIAKAVWWELSQVNTTIVNESWVSRSVGPLSVSKSDADNKIDGRSGLPLSITKSLPRFM